MKMEALNVFAEPAAAGIPGKRCGLLDRIGQQERGGGAEIGPGLVAPPVEPLGESTARERGGSTNASLVS